MFLSSKITNLLIENAPSRFSLESLKNLRLSSWISIFVLLVLILVSVFAPLIAPYNPYEIFYARMAPCFEFWFGTDDKGRDILSRMIYGGGYSLTIGLGSIIIALIIGSIIGACAAVCRRWISELIMRILDIFMAIPGIALVSILVLTFSTSLLSITICISIIYVPQIARIVRANILKEYNKDYVRAAMVVGEKAPRILIKHVARNCLAPILVFAILSIADAIIFEASLSFLGAGIPEPTPTWGNILADARNGVLGGRWWQALFPGLAIMLTVLSLNILAEGLTDTLSTPASIKNINNLSNNGKKNTKENDKKKREVLEFKEMYRKQYKKLQNKLDQLSVVESTRTDRKPYNPNAKTILKVEDLKIRFDRFGDIDVVDGINFEVGSHQTIGLVGESGCGKSITAYSIMRLLGKESHVSGSINYLGNELLNLSNSQMQDIRGREIAMIYQDALSALNPSMLIKKQLKQLIDRGGTRTAEELMDLVGLDSHRILNSYPHELSGGQRQRVLIAMALTRDPKLLIADEPTTALDVTVQKQIIDLLFDLQNKLGFAMIFVSHDLALVAQVSNAIYVMYAGQIVEYGTVKDIMSNPLHEYTKGLLGSVVSIEGGVDRLYQIPGTVPSPVEFPPGDRFSPRSVLSDISSNVEPVLKQYRDDYHFYAELPNEELKKYSIKPLKQ